MDDEQGRLSRRAAIAGLVGGTAAVWVAPVITSADVAAAASGCALFGIGNLVINPNATNIASFPPGGTPNPNYDVNAGSPCQDPADAIPVPVSWTTANGFRIVQYGHCDYPGTSDLDPPDSSAGPYMFCGSLQGPVDPSPQTATQTLDVSPCATDIDTGTLRYSLSAYLGGHGTNTDAMTFTATFLDSSQATIGWKQLGPVTPSDRNSVTRLVQQSATGTLPVGTRSVLFELSASGGDPTPDTRNFACADLLAFTLC